MKERLQKILSARGVASRRRAEELISAGAVSVNGVVAALGDSADPDADEILVEGKDAGTMPISAIKTQTVFRKVSRSRRTKGEASKTKIGAI